MDMYLDELPAFLQELVDDHGVTVVAADLDISRPTLYGLLHGGWPSKKVADRLRVRFIARTKKPPARKSRVQK